MNQTQNTFGRSDFSAGLQKAQEDIQNTQRDLGFFFAEQHAPQVDEGSGSLVLDRMESIGGSTAQGQSPRLPRPLRAMDPS